MVQIISSRLAFMGKKKTDNASSGKQPAQAEQSHVILDQNDLVCLQDTVDQFRRAIRSPEGASTKAATQDLGVAFTEDVYQKVNNAMRQVKSQKLKSSYERASTLQGLLNNDETLKQKFEIGKFTLHADAEKPSLVMIMPKPVPRQQFVDLTTGLSLRWLNTEMPAGSWLIDANNLKRIYCTSDESDMAALRKRHAAHSAIGQQDLKEAMSLVFSRNA